MFICLKHIMFIKSVSWNSNARLTNSSRPVLIFTLLRKKNEEYIPSNKLCLCQHGVTDFSLGATTNRGNLRVQRMRIPIDTPENPVHRVAPPRRSLTGGFSVALANHARIDARKRHGLQAKVSILSSNSYLFPFYFPKGVNAKGQG